MTDRVTINVESFMNLDGQWMVVLPGTVFDTPDASRFSPTTTQVITKGGGGALINNTHTSVTLRKK